MTALAGSVESLSRIVGRLLDLIEDDYAELRTLIDDLDHSTVKRGPFEELHTRVDALANEYEARHYGRRNPS